MGFILRGKTGGGEDYQPMPEGSHAARCIEFIDLGTQQSEWQGKVKHSRRVRIGWEVPSERMGNGRPMTVSKTYGAHLFDTSPLRKDLEGWRGKKFTPAEIDGWEAKQLMGKACLINVIHVEGKNGKTYANIQNIVSLPKGMTCGDQENDSLFFSLDEFDAAVYERLTQYVKDTIARSPEFAEATSRIGAVAQGANLDDDDVPF